MSRVEHGERIRSRQREIIPRVIGVALVVLWLVFIACMIFFSISSVLRSLSAIEHAQEATEAPEPQIIIRYATEREQEEHDLDTLLALARTVWGEARGCTTTEQAAVVWCVLNRADRPEWPDDPLEVVQQPNQFSGYDAENPVWPETLALVEDVLDRWELEKTAVGDVGRVLPKEYVFFEGDGRHNYFRTEYKGGTIWDWSLNSPYEEKNDEKNEILFCGPSVALGKPDLEKHKAEVESL